MSMLVRHNSAALAGLGPSTSYARTQVAGDEDEDEHEAVHHAAAVAGAPSLPTTPALLSFARYPQQQNPLGQFRPMMRHNFHPQLPTPPTLPLPPHGPQQQLDEDQLEDDDGLYSDEDPAQPTSKPQRQPAKRKAGPAGSAAAGAGGGGGARARRTSAGRKRTATPDDEEESEHAGSDDQDDGSDGSGRRPLKRARLNAPEPIPNLTKKSRGRRVPRADDAEATNEYSARKYICPVPECSKGFSRGEHLKRHTRSIHTNDRPFTCTVKGCGRTFTRHDNLLQHQRAHAAPLLVPLPPTP